METTEKDVSKMSLEEKRREARKKRIQGNISDRLSFISSHTEALKNEDKKPEEVKSDYNEPQSPILNILESINGNSGGGNVTMQPHQVRDPITFTVLRWLGVLFFSLIFTSISILSCSPELFESSNGLLSSNQEATTLLQSIIQKYQWAIRILVTLLIEPQIKSTNYTNSLNKGIGTYQSITQTLYTYGILLSIWLLWEYVIVYRTKKNNSIVRQKSFLSISRSDGLLIAFFYVVILDLILRYKHLIFNFDQLIYINDNYLISILYYPLIIAFIGQFIINQILKIDLVQMNQNILRIATGVTHFALSLIILLFFIDWWECSSCYSKSFGLIYIISSKSRGLFLWAHICINFVSRILP